MATKTRRKKPWVCTNGHWLSRSPNGHPVCYFCSRNAMAIRRGKKMGFCHRGHQRPVGSTNCSMCTDWNSTPWHQELDETGKATCPNGHIVTPTDGMSYNKTRRWCTQCKADWNKANHEKRRAEGYNQKHGRNGLCNAQKHPWSEAMAEPRLDKRNNRTIIHCKGCRQDYRRDYHWRKEIEKEQSQPAPDHLIDWVVALELVTYGTKYLSTSLRRGTSWGPTAAEKWVAYCTWKTHNGREPSYDAVVQEQWFALWRDEGLELGFVRHLDIWGLLGSLGDKAYRENTLLFTPEDE